MRRASLVRLVVPMIAACKSAPAPTAEHAPQEPTSSASAAEAKPSASAPSEARVTSASSAFAARVVGKQELDDEARGERAFAARLYASLRARPGNISFSPATIRIALGMAYAGARGATSEEMARALSLAPKSDDANARFATTLRAWSAWENKPADGEPIVMHVDSRCWIGAGRAIRPELARVLVASYAAPLEALDFADQSASRATINAWADRQTEHRIPALLAAGEPSPDTRFLIASTAYFKAAWALKFPHQTTKEGDFFVGAGKLVRANLMTQKVKLRYADVGDAKVVELPYWPNDASMVVVLPNAKDGLAALEASMDEGSIGRFTKAMKFADVDLTLPRFAVTGSFSLAEALASLGMPSAFIGGKADFSGIDGTRELFLSEIVHKAFVHVDETGTEAAAASYFGGRGTGPGPTYVEVRADHPFLFFIRDAAHGGVLFMGRVVDPSR